MFIIPVTAIANAAGRAAIEARLRAAGASDAGRAVSLDPAGPAETAGLNEAIGLGRVVRTSSGKYFFNPAAKASGEMAMAVLLFLLVAASVVATAVALAKFALD